MIGIHYYSKVYLHTYVYDIYECKFFYVYILSLVSLKTYVYCLNLQEKLVYRGFLEYVGSAHDSWFLMKCATPRILITTSTYQSFCTQDCSTVLQEIDDFWDFLLAPNNNLVAIHKYNTKYD